MYCPRYSNHDPSPSAQYGLWLTLLPAAALWLCARTRLFSRVPFTGVATGVRRQFCGPLSPSQLTVRRRRSDSGDAGLRSGSREWGREASSLGGEPGPRSNAR